LANRSAAAGRECSDGKETRTLTCPVAMLEHYLSKTAATAGDKNVLVPPYLTLKSA